MNGRKHRNRLHPLLVTDQFCDLGRTNVIQPRRPVLDGFHFRFEIFHRFRHLLPRTIELFAGGFLRINRQRVEHRFRNGHASIESGVQTAERLMDAAITSVLERRLHRQQLLFQHAQLLSLGLDSLSLFRIQLGDFGGRRFAPLFPIPVERGERILTQSARNIDRQNTSQPGGLRWFGVVPSPGSRNQSCSQRQN